MRVCEGSLFYLMISLKVFLRLRKTKTMQVPMQVIPCDGGTKRYSKNRNLPHKSFFQHPFENIERKGFHGGQREKF